MEIQEAIKSLKNIVEYWTYRPTEVEAATMAIEALEKQIPKKPTKDKEQNIRYTSAYSCPTCGNGFSGTGIAIYCYHCGQKLDWDLFGLGDGINSICDCGKTVDIGNISDNFKYVGCDEDNNPYFECNICHKHVAG